MGGTPCLPVQPASWLRLGSARVLALAHRGMPRRAASSAAATSVAQRHSRAGDTPAPHGSLRLPRPPSGRAPAQGIPLASPYSPLAGCVSALPRTRSRSSLQASTCRPPRAAKVDPPLHPLARLLPRQSAARKRSDTCRETRGLVRSVSRYVTSSPLHSGRPRELPASSRTSFPVRVVKICFLHYCFGLRLFVFFGLLHDFRPPRQLLRLQFAIFPAKLALFPTNFPCNKNNFRAHNFTLIVSV